MLEDLVQINLPSSLISTIDVAFGDDRHRHTSYSSRSFPENLGSGSIPVTPKVLISLMSILDFETVHLFLLQFQSYIHYVCIVIF